MNTETTITAPAGWTICAVPESDNKVLIDTFLQMGAECISKEFGSVEEATKFRGSIANYISKKEISDVKAERKENVVYLMRK